MAIAACRYTTHAKSLTSASTGHAAFSSTIAALKGQWPFLRSLAVLDPKNSTIGGLISL